MLTTILTTVVPAIPGIVKTVQGLFKSAPKSAETNKAKLDTAVKLVQPIIDGLVKDGTLPPQAKRVEVIEKAVELVVHSLKADGKLEDPVPVAPVETVSMSALPEKPDAPVVSLVGKYIITVERA